MSSEAEHQAVTRFREYLRLESVHPDPDYDGCIAWLRNQAKEIGLEFSIKEFDGTKAFALWLTWEGADPELKSVMLNSHIDVVPVDPSKWTYPPFAAHKDAEGRIFARGSQDMKCVGVQYLESIRNLKSRGFVPLRTVHVSFMPDEEVGGGKGMLEFVKSEEFRNLNVAFSMDEGLASHDDSFDLFYGERVCWQVKFIAKGQTGNGSLLHENTAGEKIQKILTKMLEIREIEKNRMKVSGLDLGDVTTINLTMIKGGLQPNVVPPELSVSFDIRITPSWNVGDVTKLLDDVCREAGSEVTYEFTLKIPVAKSTQLVDTNPWWRNFEEATNLLGMKLNKRIFPAGTDSRYLREIGIPALGFSPMNNTPVLLHDHDEFLHEHVFLRGILIYDEILPKLFNLPKSDSL